MLAAWNVLQEAFRTQHTPETPDVEPDVKPDVKPAFCRRPSHGSAALWHTTAPPESWTIPSRAWWWAPVRWQRLSCARIWQPAIVDCTGLVRLHHWIWLQPHGLYRKCWSLQWSSRSLLLHCRLRNPRQVRRAAFNNLLLHRMMLLVTRTQTLHFNQAPRQLHLKSAKFSLLVL